MQMSWSHLEEMILEWASAEENAEIIRISIHILNNLNEECDTICGRLESHLWKKELEALLINIYLVNGETLNLIYKNKNLNHFW